MKQGTATKKRTKLSLKESLKNTVELEEARSRSRRWTDASLTQAHEREKVALESGGEILKFISS